MNSNVLSGSDDELAAILQDENKKAEKKKLNKRSAKKGPPIAKKRTKIIPPPDRAKSEYEKHLEKLVFGDKAGLLENLKKAAGEEDSPTAKKERKPVWQDSDDEDFQIGDVVRESKWTGSLEYLDKGKKYSDLLKTKFERLQAPPKWADLDREREADSDEELLQSVGHLGKQTVGGLPANNINFKKLKDLNRATYAEGSITSIQFHPGSTVALVAGLRGIATVYSIDGQKNEKLHSVQFQQFPIKCARILPDGKEVFIGGVKNYFYAYDLMLGEANRVFLPKIITKMHKFEVSPCGKYFAACGRFGEVHLLDSCSKELLKTFKQEDVCPALRFTLDSSKLIAHSTASEVSVFDLRQQKIEHIFMDQGCISGKCIAISPNNRMVATGSNEGVVNIYSYSDVMASKNPQPEKTIYNLTTSISDLNFNRSSEVLGMCSESVAGAVKLVHFPSGTIFANYPGFKANIGRIRTLEFSPGSGYLALGSAAKEVPLYRLKHFSNY